MDEGQILGNDREQKSFQYVMALHGAPAFLRRAHQVQMAWDALLEQCRRQREQWLGSVRSRLAVLHALAGEWTDLQRVLANPADADLLAALQRDLQPQLRQPCARMASAQALRTALAELVESLQLFNERWHHHLAKLDLSEINRLREDYNRFYVLEKECAVRSPVIARQGFQRLAPATREDVAASFPALAVPEIGR
jgi:hypothetical protein